MRQEPVPEQPEPSGSRSRYGAVVAFLLTFWASYAPAQPPDLPAAATPGGASPEAVFQVTIPEITPEVVPIPPTVQRPLGVEEGERIFVREFSITGTRDHPEHGISTKEVDALVEKLRIERQKLDGVAEDGFTEDEHKEVLAFLKGVVNSPDLDMKFDEYQALIDKLRIEKIKREEGLTIGQLQQVADEVTQYYRKAGYMLAKAYIPAQEVTRGVVSIEVLEGDLGQVLVEGNRRFSRDLLARPFQELLDAPVVVDSMESALSLLSDYPGISVFGILQPGQAIGTTDLVLKVQSEKLYNFTVGYDNHASRLTGTRRATLDFDLNSPLLSADRLSGRMIQSFRPRNALFYNVNYEIPIFSPSTFLGAGAGRNMFDIGQELADQDFSGISENKRLFARHSFLRSREKNLQARLEFTRKQSQTLQKKVVLAEDDLAVLSLGLSFDRINRESQSIDAATVRWDRGLAGMFGGMADGEGVANTNDPPSSRLTGSGEQLDGAFDKLVMSGARVVKLAEEQTLLMRFSGQYTADPLVSVEQFAIGGPDSVRAFPVSEYLMDRGFFASVDWTINAPFISERPVYGERTWGDILKLSFFADYGQGWLIDAREDETDNISLAGAGVGMQVLLPGDVVAKVQAAHPIGPEDSSNGDATQVWFDFKYSF